MKAAASAAVLALAVLLVLPVALGGLVVLGLVSEVPEDCTNEVAVVGTVPEQVGEFSGVQVENAAMIVAQANERGMGAQGALIALVTAIQESSLRNLANDGSFRRPPSSRVMTAEQWAEIQPLLAVSTSQPHDGVAADWDSVGLMQQRPTAGYGGSGSLQERIVALMDPETAVGAFFDRLSAIPDWSTLPAGDAAQAVQRSAYPDRYASHINAANELMLALSGVQLVPTGECTTVGDWLVGAATGPAKAAIDWAANQLGKLYEWAAAGPDTFDCSGLVQQSWLQTGVQLPRTSRAQYRATERIPYEEIQPGDLVFWAKDTTDPSTIYHVAMWIGPNEIIEAPAPGLTVRKAPMRWAGAMPTAGRPVQQ